MAKKIALSYGELLSYAPGVNGELKIGVAVSGGRDSVALLHCLKSLADDNADKYPLIKVTAINVEHGIRGEESLHDSEFVRQLCERLSIPLRAYSVKAVQYAEENGYTLEQAGRILRYKIFDKLIEDGECDLIALAHHLDDQAETVFMRILRGTGVRGLIGMRKVSGRYIRPFLDYDRESIDEYIKSYDLTYVEDATNCDTAYTRNFLRMQINELKKRFPSMNEAVRRLAASAAETDEFIEAQLPKIAVKDGISYIKTSDCENALIAKRLIFKAASALGITQDIEERHYALILNLISAESGKYLNLTHGLCVHKEGEHLVFTLKRDSDNSFERTFGEGVFEEIGVSVERVNVTDVRYAGDTLFIDADKIPENAVIRTRRDGDCICKFGGGTKSLGDFLTDKKIPARVRNELKIVAVESKVYAVFGVEISADAKIDGNTKKVYALRILKNN